VTRNVSTSLCPSLLELLELFQRRHHQRYGHRPEQGHVNCDFVLVWEVDLTYHGRLEESLLRLSFSNPRMLQRSIVVAFVEMRACRLQMVNGFLYRVRDIVWNGDAGQLERKPGQCAEG
jgi:hypothetical protein